MAKDFQLLKTLFFAHCEFTRPTHFLPVIAHLSMIFYTIWRLTDQNQLSIKFTYFW